jgi:hypothetical protein
MLYSGIQFSNLAMSLFTLSITLEASVRDVDNVVINEYLLSNITFTFSSLSKHPSMTKHTLFMPISMALAIINLIQALSGTLPL